jgi:hypothetical protein
MRYALAHARAPHLHERTTPNCNGIDFPKLRAGRLARLQTRMRVYDLPVALLYNTLTGELPGLQGRDKELVMGDAICDWLGWKRPA